jgi:hypothetical protein
MSIIKHGKIHIITQQQMADKNHKTPMDKKTGQTSFMKKTFHTKFQLWHNAVFLINAAIHSFISGNRNKLTSNSW